MSTNESGDTMVEALPPRQPRSGGSDRRPAVAAVGARVVRRDHRRAARSRLPATAPARAGDRHRDRLARAVARGVRRGSAGRGRIRRWRSRATRPPTLHARRIVTPAVGDPRASCAAAVRERDVRRPRDHAGAASGLRRVRAADGSPRGVPGRVGERVHAPRPARGRARRRIRRGFRWSPSIGGCRLRACAQDPAVRIIESEERKHGLARLDHRAAARRTTRHIPCTSIVGRCREASTSRSCPSRICT